MASKLIPVSEKQLKENLVLDKAETLIQYGLFLKKDNPEQAGKMFQQAEVLLKDFAPGEDERGKQVGERINDMRSRIKDVISIFSKRQCGREAAHLFQIRLLVHRAFQTRDFPAARRVAP